MRVKLVIRMVESEEAYLDTFRSADVISEQSSWRLQAVLALFELVYRAWTGLLWSLNVLVLASRSEALWAVHAHRRR